MLAKTSSHAPLGIDGKIVSVEVDLRKGIPGLDIVGLPDSAVKEARERVRVAIKNSGLQFPPHRILINLSPAGIRKMGASYDLPMALAILAASGQIPVSVLEKSMILGELNLSGKIKPVNGVLAAVGAGLKEGISTFLVPSENSREACLLNCGNIYGIRTLMEGVDVCKGLAEGFSVPDSPETVIKEVPPLYYGDISDIKGQWVLKRAMEVAAAGKHHMFLFGPPGCGKSMSAKRLPTILPDLGQEESLLVTSIYSIAGLLSPDQGLITAPPFRMPHHSASREGIIGGGTVPRPGEVSLAHEGILFLDEAPEYKRDLLQSLREPVEEGSVYISRASGSLRFPAYFQLVMAANPCPCGNLGHKERSCLCSTSDIYRYWKQIGGALMDRIDIRIPLKPSLETLTEESGPGRPFLETSDMVKQRVEKAVLRQQERFKGYSFSRNGGILPGFLDQFCRISSKSRKILISAAEKLALSSRACHSILKLSRTIADLEEEEEIHEEYILEAIQYRRYGDKDFFWNFQ